MLLFEAGIWCGAGAPEITFDHWSDFAFDVYPSDSRIPIQSWVHMMHIDDHILPRVRSCRKTDGSKSDVQKLRIRLACWGPGYAA
jgi:hypothetical protein